MSGNMEALLQQVLDRLGAIERKLGGAGGGGGGGDERSALAVDFEAAILGGPAKTAIDNLAKVSGEDGVKLVSSRRPRRRGIRRRSRRPARERER